MDWANHPGIVRAAAIIKKGGIVACPAEGVWGLSCDVWCEAAIKRILELKNRPASKGLILITHSVKSLRFFAPDLTSDQNALITDFGEENPVTWLSPHSGRVSKLITGHHPCLAVRIVRHSPIAALCARVGVPLVSTSANPAGLPPSRTAEEVSSCFGTALDFIAPGEIGNARNSSEIRDLLTLEIVRNP